MCGIAGAMFFRGAEPERANAVAGRMRDALEHRGPDGSGTWCTGRPGGPTVALAHTRLAIIDLSEAGRQPMSDGAGLTVVYNGETYNYRALRRELEQTGAAFRTQTDTEVVLAAYARWGLDAIRRLQGMFAFAIWDDVRERLVIARDRLGVKPLYYSAGAGVFAFASELRALLATGVVPRHVDPAGVWHYLGYQTTPTPQTLVAGVRMLEPGHALVVDRSGHFETHNYWDLLSEASTGARQASLEQARERVGELLHDAVASHLVSDVPVGVFLSGGVDSSALVAIMRAQGVTPRTFTVAFSEKGYDESAQARLVATTFQTDHTEIRLHESDLLDMMPGVLSAIDHPSGDGVNTYVVSRVVREHGVPVALSGLGGDELFGGYPSFRRLERLLPATRQWGRSPRVMRRAAADVVRAVGGRSVAARKAAAVLECDGDLAAVWPVTRQVFSPRERELLLPVGRGLTGDRAESYGPLLAEAYARTSDADLWSLVSYAEARTYMHDVLLRDTDQMSMAHALEVRVPLLDHPLVEYVMGLPDRLKRQGALPKSLLIDSLPISLPRDAADRPKQGFTLPFDRWMRGALRPLCEHHLGSAGLDGRGLFRPGEVPRLWRQFLGGAPGVTWSRLWTLVALDAWLDRHGITGPSA
jgi:asparagine synthase (glutamine-hydrolysing)